MGARVELIPISLHNKYVDMLLCRIRKQNGMIKRYDWYSDMLMARAAEVILVDEVT